jgi:hypothetical protein
MKKFPRVALAVVSVCLLISGCHSANRYWGGCSRGSCPAPGMGVSPYTGDPSEGVPQGSGTRSQPGYPAAIFQGSGSR